MRKVMLFLALAVSAHGVVAFAQSAPAAPAQAPAAAAAPTGFRGWFLREVDSLEKKYVDLAQAVPQEKFTWRPGEGVRSVSEVHLHVAGSNFRLPSLAGIKPPAGIEFKNYEKSTTDKVKVVEQLKNSFEHLRQAITKTPDADLDKTVKLFGREANNREVFLLIVTHMHEHLGQSIAYARVNGVVPPWTEEQQQRQRQQAPRPSE